MNMEREEKMKDFALGKLNFLLIAVAVVLIVVGFMLMSGGGSTDGVSFNPEIFSKRRIAVAPIVTMAGFILMVFGILASDRKRAATDKDALK